MKKIFVIRLSMLIERCSGLFRSLLGRIHRHRFARFGHHFSFDPYGVYSYENISIGNHVNLGYRPILLASRSKICIGNYVMFGPEVTIRGGNHRIDIMGRYMVDIKDTEKRPEDDLGVVIEDDVWVGTRAVILSGVIVGRGAVVAAGSIVTKSVPPYAIVGGNPAKVIRMRWSGHEIQQHEEILRQCER
jgi:acetyltransferase-like isoleucine patch superfamily enzyme